MKKFVIALIIVATCFAILCSSVLAAASEDRPPIDGKEYVDTVFDRDAYNDGIEPSFYLDGMYANIFEVLSVERDLEDYDLVTIGNDMFQYQFLAYGSDWLAGDHCVVIMSENGTTEVVDDIVLAARYAP